MTHSCACQTSDFLFLGFGSIKSVLFTSSDILSGDGCSITFSASSMLESVFLIFRNSFRKAAIFRTGPPGVLIILYEPYFFKGLKINIRLVIGSLVDLFTCHIHQGIIGLNCIVHISVHIDLGIRQESLK